MPLKDRLPNQLFHLALITCQEILGDNGLKSLLNFAKLQKFIGNFPPATLDLEHSSEDFTRLLTSLIDMMGEKGARPILFRGGMRSFEIMREQFPTLWNLEGIEPGQKTPDRLFEEYTKIQGIIAQAGEHIFGDNLYKLGDCPEGIAFEIAPCYWCKDVHTQAPICHGEVGFKAAAARWIFGKDITIEETHCIAKGDPMCRFVMHRPV